MRPAGFRLSAPERPHRSRGRTPRARYWKTEREFNVNVPERNYERAAELFATALEAHTGGLPTPLREAAGDLVRTWANASGRGAPRAG